MNGYHAEVRHIIGAKLTEQGRTRAQAYLMDKSEPLDCNQAGTGESSALWRQVANQNKKMAPMTASSPCLAYSNSLIVISLVLKLYFS